MDPRDEPSTIILLNEPNSKMASDDILLTVPVERITQPFTEKLLAVYCN